MTGDRCGLCGAVESGESDVYVLGVVTEDDLGVQLDTNMCGTCFVRWAQRNWRAITDKANGKIRLHGV